MKTEKSMVEKIFEEEDAVLFKALDEAAKEYNRQLFAVCKTIGMPMWCGLRKISEGLGMPPAQKYPPFTIDPTCACEDCKYWLKETHGKTS